VKGKDFLLRNLITFDFELFECIMEKHSAQPNWDDRTQACKEINVPMNVALSHVKSPVNCTSTNTWRTKCCGRCVFLRKKEMNWIWICVIVVYVDGEVVGNSLLERRQMKAILKNWALIIYNNSFITISLIIERVRPPLQFSFEKVSQNLLPYFFFFPSKNT
jgi:hypothetical protein